MRFSVKTLIFAAAVFAVAGGAALWAPWEAGAGCGITIKANYSTPVKSGADVLQLRVLFGDYHASGNKSQSRIQGGAWAKLGDAAIKTLSPGQNFTQASELSLGCNINHQYRVIVLAFKGNTTISSAYKYYPSSSTYTTSSTIDLGDLGKLFQ